MGKRKDLAERFRIGDFVEDGDSSGLVVAGVTVPTTGETYYIFVGADGHLNGQYHNGLISGTHLDQPVEVHDLAGGRLLTTLQAKPAPDTTAREKAAAQDRRDVLNYLERLAQRIRVNGRKGSSIVKAFRAFDIEYQGQPETKWSVVQLALGAWRQLDLEEQRRILNGWRPNAVIPAVAKAFDRTIARPAQETADRVLTLEFTERNAIATAETLLTHGLMNDVTITIREGTTRQEAIASLRTALAAMETRWNDMIDLADREFLGIAGKAKDQAAPKAVGASKKPRTTKSSDSLKLGGQENQQTKAVAA